MFCEECGKEIQSEWKICPHCGKAIGKVKLPEGTTIEQPLIKQRKSLFRRWRSWIIAIAAVLILLHVFGSGVKKAEFGSPIIVKDVAYISFNEGAFFEGPVFPLYATDDNTGIKYGGEGVMYGIYGVVENLSSQMADINEIYDIKVIFDGKYESETYLWLENEEQTEFLGFDLSDQIFLNPDAVINPKDKYHCVLIGQAGNTIFQETKEAIVELKILKDVDDLKKYVTYRIPLVINE